LRLPLPAGNAGLHSDVLAEFPYKEKKNRMRLRQRPLWTPLSRKTFLAALAAALALAASGWKAASVGTGSGGNFRVALVMSGPTSDNGWNAGAYNALLAVRKELNLSEQDSPSVDSQSTPEKRDESLRAFASKGFNIVYGHGNEYEEPALKMESEFPQTLFVISSGRKVGHNTTPIIIELEDGAYLEGMLAASMSKANKLGLVGAQEIPPVQSVFQAFEAGAKAVKPTIQVLKPLYTGSWDDVGKAKQATLAIIDQGADVIMQDVDAAAQGVFNAVQERKDRGVWALGTNSDQNKAAPDVILASAPIYYDKAFISIAKEVKAGTFQPNNRPFGMKEGVVGFVLNPALANKIPADLKARLEETQKKITEGLLAVPKG